ncbi:MAG: [acyl-carrier-protein] S-malonyltransferase [Planctomycetota bacterium]|jgi:[acyl-carrier-protein] S-malonyltransferase
MGKTALLFPGQGAQKVGMAADFVEKYPVARELFDRANETLGYDISRIVLSGPDEELTQTRYCQPAIYLAGAAITSVLESVGKLSRKDIDCTAGLSLGEYTALYFAGVFTFEEGLSLVARRGEAMQEASDSPASGMVSLLGADLEVATKVAAEAAGDDVLVVANLLSPGQVVLSGAMTACGRVPEIAKSHGIRRAIPLKVAGAFHSPLMSSAATKLKAVLDSMDLKDPAIPVAGNVTGAYMTRAAEIRDALERQVVEPVLWQNAMGTMIEDGVETFVESGPGSVLSGLMRKIDRQKTCVSYDKVEDLD